MTVFLFLVLFLLCFIIIGKGLIEREKMIQFPFLSACVFLGWMLPQLVGLTNNPYLPSDGLEKTIFMAILCLAAAWMGYDLNKRPAKLFWWRFDQKRLLLGSFILSLLGAYFFYQVSLRAADVIAEFGGAWTGSITIYIFFAKLMNVGMAIALILYLSKPNIPSLLIFLFDLMFFLDRIFIKGRRAAMVELGLMLLMALWFQRRWLAPRSVIVAVIVVGALVINSIGDYRNTMMGPNHTSWSGAGISKILNIDFVGNLERIATGHAGDHELMNAVMNIEATDRLLNFDYGLSLWNRFVHSYVPGQWVGYDFKKELMFGKDNNAYDEFNYTGFSGSTMTGLSDSFMSFWYFGAVIFYIIGLIMSRWYKAAMSGNIVAQIIMILVITASLHAITHMTHWFFIFFVQYLIFLLPVLIFARVRRRNKYTINQEYAADLNAQHMI